MVRIYICGEVALVCVFDLYLRLYLRNKVVDTSERTGAN